MAMAQTDMKKWWRTLPLIRRVRADGYGGRYCCVGTYGFPGRCFRWSATVLSQSCSCWWAWCTTGRTRGTFRLSAGWARLPVYTGLMVLASSVAGLPGLAGYFSSFVSGRVFCERFHLVFGVSLCSSFLQVLSVIGILVQRAFSAHAAESVPWISTPSGKV